MPVSNDLTISPGRAVCLTFRFELDGGLTAEASKEPLWYIQGQEGLPAKVQEALLGKKKGDEVVVRLTAKDAVGEVRGAWIKTSPRGLFKAAEPLALGERVTVTQSGESATARVVKLDAQSVTLDFNSPLAGLPMTARVRVEAVALAVPTPT
jgi:FKBP-type peptidyl-prolyl cis-trans isomerase 2